MGAAWGDRPVPVDGDDSWDEYFVTYNNAFFATNCCMSLCVFAAMIFAMGSGVGEYEKGRKGYAGYVAR